MNDPSGTNFDVSSGYLLIGEAQYLVNRGKDAKGLPATYKVGAWYNSNSFKDPFFTNGASASAEEPFALNGGSRRGDWSAYGTLDQLVVRLPGSEDGGLGLTARAMAAPGDRNLVDVFAQGGVTYKGGFDRPGDTMGIGVERAHVSSRTRAGDLAAAEALGTFHPLRSDETVVEPTYQAQIAPWWQVPTRRAIRAVARRRPARPEPPWSSHWRCARAGSAKRRYLLTEHGVLRDRMLSVSGTALLYRCHPRTSGPSSNCRGDDDRTN